MSFFQRETVFVFFAINVHKSNNFQVKCILKTSVRNYMHIFKQKFYAFVFTKWINRVRPMISGYSVSDLKFNHLETSVLEFIQADSFW